MNRRDFLKTGSLAAAGLAIGLQPSISFKEAQLNPSKREQFVKQEKSNLYRLIQDTWGAETSTQVDNIAYIANSNESPGNAGIIYGPAENFFPGKPANLEIKIFDGIFDQGYNANDFEAIIGLKEGSLASLLVGNQNISRELFEGNGDFDSYLFDIFGEALTFGLTAQTIMKNVNWQKEYSAAFNSELKQGYILSTGATLVHLSGTNNPDKRILNHLLDIKKSIPVPTISYENVVPTQFFDRFKMKNIYIQDNSITVQSDFGNFNYSKQ